MSKVKKSLIILIPVLLLMTLFISLFYNENNVDLGAGYVYDSEHKHILGKIDIPPTVISFDNDNNFIIVKQKPTEFHNSIYDKMEYDYKFGRNFSYFWIIFKREQKVFGPMDSIKFLELKEKYNIPNSLKI